MRLLRLKLQQIEQKAHELWPWDECDFIKKIEGKGISLGSSDYKSK